jgi:hypothetical protein
MGLTSVKRNEPLYQGFNDSKYGLPSSKNMVAAGLLQEERARFYTTTPDRLPHTGADSRPLKVTFRGPPAQWHDDVGSLVLFPL